MRARHLHARTLTACLVVASLCACGSPASEREQVAPAARASAPETSPQSIAEPAPEIEAPARTPAPPPPPPPAAEPAAELEQHASALAETPQVATPPKGALSKEAIRRSIHAGINSIRACANALLSVAPTTGLRWTVRFVIGPKGRVTSAKMIESADSSRAADECVLKAVRGFAFPPPDDGGEVVVTYPFIVDVAGG